MKAVKGRVGENKIKIMNLKLSYLEFSFSKIIPINLGRKVFCFKKEFTITG